MAGHDSRIDTKVSAVPTGMAVDSVVKLTEYNFYPTQHSWNDIIPGNMEMISILKNGNLLNQNKVLWHSGKTKNNRRWTCGMPHRTW